MVDDNNRYGRNRNLWRKVYSFKRRKPIRKYLVDSKTGVTFSYNLQGTLRHRDFFVIKSSLTASAIVPVVIVGEYDEGLIYFTNTNFATTSFTTCFSNTPDAVVLSVESSSDSSDYVIPYGITFNSCSMSVGLSAPFSGSVRYRAVYSSNGYPALVSSSFEPSSGSFQVSAGHITASQAIDYTASYAAGDGSIQFFAKTAWDFFGNADNDVFISEDEVSNISTKGTISSPLNNPIYFIAFF